VRGMLQYPQQHDLARLASRLCGLTGAVHTDLGDRRAARDWLHTAGRYAGMSGDLATRYWVAMAQAMTATYARPRACPGHRRPGNRGAGSRLQRGGCSPASRPAPSSPLPNASRTA